jgi:hypothetical protein
LSSSSSPKEIKTRKRNKQQEKVEAAVCACPLKAATSRKKAGKQSPPL